jgi:hypothetical protein
VTKQVSARVEGLALAALPYSSGGLAGRPTARSSLATLRWLPLRLPPLPKGLLNVLLRFTGLVRPGEVDLPSEQPPGALPTEKQPDSLSESTHLEGLRGVEGDANVIPKKPLLLAVTAVLSLLATTACTPTSATTSPTGSSAPPVTASPSVTTTPTDTPSSTPTPTLDADQAAALMAAESYEEALAKVRANPVKYDQYKMIDLLKPLAFDDMIQANLNGIRSWRDNGWHEEGSQVILRRDVDLPNVTSNGTTRVAVTICKDQRELIVVDAKGKTVTAEAAQGPDFLQNTYDMRRGKAEDSFRVYEFGGDEVEGCSA